MDLSGLPAPLKLDILHRIANLVNADDAPQPNNAFVEQLMAIHEPCQYTFRPLSLIKHHLIEQRIQHTSFFYKAFKELNALGYSLVEDFLPKERIASVCESLKSFDLSSLKPGRMNTNSLLEDDVEIWKDSSYRGDRIAWLKKDDENLSSELKFLLGEMDSIRDLMNDELDFKSERVEVYCKL
jgi:hypothetical protein